MSAPADLMQIERMIEAGQLAEAQVLLRPILAATPSAEAYYLAARCVSDSDQAVYLADQALRLDPGHVRAQTLHQSLKPAMPPGIVRPAAQPPIQRVLEVVTPVIQWVIAAPVRIAVTVGLAVVARGLLLNTAGTSSGPCRATLDEVRREGLAVIRARYDELIANMTSAIRGIDGNYADLRIVSAQCGTPPRPYRVTTFEEWCVVVEPGIIVRPVGRDFARYSIVLERDGLLWRIKTANTLIADEEEFLYLSCTNFRKNEPR